MDASAQPIHLALEAVARLRQQRAANPLLARASSDIKRFQAQRFGATYSDLLSSPRYQTTAQFFLTELYGDQDYAERDRQFGRIAGTIERLFPQPVVSAAAALAQVHAMTEQLDDAMARQWMQMPIGAIGPVLTEASATEWAACYVRCWRLVADEAARRQQLARVLQLGEALNRLTRTPGLRTMLKVMRRPAAAAGLASLQRFLESGFDAFATMRGADEFLDTISARENRWMQLLFFADESDCIAQLAILFTKPAPT